MMLKVGQFREGFSFFNSPKNRTKNFCPSRLGQKSKLSSSFLGELETPKRHFGINSPLVNKKLTCHISCIGNGLKIKEVKLQCWFDLVSRVAYNVFLRFRSLQLDILNGLILLDLKIRITQ